MGEDETDDWDDVPEPQSRHDRIQRITSPEGTLQRPRHDHPGTKDLSDGSSANEPVYLKRRIFLLSRAGSVRHLKSKLTSLADVLNGIFMHFFCCNALH